MNKRIVSHYQIIEKIGEGGMGEVFLAEDTKLKRKVALKFLSQHLTIDQEAKARFEREAQATAALNYPNIITIYEIGEHEGQTYIAMEYVDGKTLRQLLIDNGQLKIDNCIDITTQICEGLAKAHEAGFVHRDIKPANIMITDRGEVKIVDFGLAKLARQTKLTREGTTLGTIAYMSPEQARGELLDHRTDIWALGVILYEMLTGQLPFKGDYEQAVIYSILNEEPEKVSDLETGIPVELERIINKALAKDPIDRYQSAVEILHDLNQIKKVYEEKPVGPKINFRKIMKPGNAIPVVLLLMFFIFIVIWIFNKRSKVEWAKYSAIPEIQRLADERDWNAAYNLAKEVQEIIPEDSMLLKIWSNITHVVPIKCEPEGVKVYRKFYTEFDADWEYLGQTPIDSIRFPKGFSRLKFEKDGFQTVHAAVYSVWIKNMHFKLDKINTIPDGMVRISGGKYVLNIPGLDHLDSVKLGDYLIDKYEVTNKEYKRFVDDGGYKKKEYWKHPVIKDGRVLTWEEAMMEFKDRTGRSGPATWEVEDYPEGEEDYPVAGVSWFEAVAYAEYIGKSLPTIYHWNVASRTTWASTYIIPLSNFGDKGPAPVGSYKGMSPWGTYDMAGNVREWCWNQTGPDNKHYILGGTWNDPYYMFNDANALSPFDRSVKNGFRCALYLPENTPPPITANPVAIPSRDYTKETSVSDEIFQIYKRIYAYDKTDLNPAIESIKEEKDWREEKIFFNAAYGNERMFAYLFLPKNVNPPHQTIVYFPGSQVIYKRSSKEFGWKLIWQLVKSGRALIYPIYKGTYERGDGLNSDYADTTNFYRDHVIYWYRDLARSIDYLETRNDIEINKIAYIGVSWGAELGALLPALEKRLKVNILWAGGLPLQRSLPEVDIFNFTPRINIPTLMLNGIYDHFFPVEKTQIPLYNLLGVSEKDKRHVIFETGHALPTNKAIKEVFDWLDKYLGAVK